MTTAQTTSQNRPQSRGTRSSTAAGARRRTPAKKATAAETPTRRAGPRATPARAATPAKAVAPSEGGSDLVTWQEVPMPHLKVPVVHVNAPAARSLVAQTRWTARTITSAVPPPKRLLYYGGVGLLAALGILEWPVAAAVAAGVWVATHTARRGELQSSAAP